MHAPSEYYKSRSSPYPTESSKPELGYIWTGLGPEILPMPTREEVYGLRDKDSEKATQSEARGKGKRDDRRKRKEPREKREKKGGRERAKARNRDKDAGTVL